MSNLRCRKGDLAIFTKHSNPDFIGRLVHVVEANPNPDFDWSVVLLSEPVHTRNYHTGRAGLFQRVFADDDELTPIRGNLSEFSVPVVKSKPVAPRVKEDCHV